MFSNNPVYTEASDTATRVYDIMQDLFFATDPNEAIRVERFEGRTLDLDAGWSWSQVDQVLHGHTSNGDPYNIALDNIRSVVNL